MWESMMGKSITPNAFSRDAYEAPRYPLPMRLQRGDLDRQFFQSAAHALQRRRLHGFHALEVLEGFIDARARDDHDAVAVADHHIARSDRDAAADNRQADRAGSAPLRRIRRDAHGEGRQANGFEVVKVAHKAVGDEARGAAISRDIHQEISGHRCADIAIGRDHEHVARLGFGERRHEREIIERPAIAGERNADHRAADEPLDPPVEGARAVHRVDDEARRRAEAFDEIGRWAVDGWGKNNRRRFLDHGRPYNQVWGGGGIGAPAPAARNARPARPGQPSAPGQPVQALSLFDTRARVVNIGIQEKEGFLPATEP